jgi:hypothetical protein
VSRVRPPVSLHLHVPRPNNSVSISRNSIRQLQECMPRGQQKGGESFGI